MFTGIRKYLRFLDCQNPYFCEICLKIICIFTENSKSEYLQTFIYMISAFNIIKKKILFEMHLSSI